MFVVFFFFSSRRRHTRFDCDWSSDVCSSDLDPRRVAAAVRRPRAPLPSGAAPPLARGSIAHRHRGGRRVTASASRDRLRLSVIVPAYNEAPTIERSEEHTSELQSQSNLVCRLLLEKKTDKGKDTRDYLAAAFPELNAWERAGADASSAGMVDAGFENQKELTKMQLDNQKEIAEMQNETQKEIAGIQSATSFLKTKHQLHAQNFFPSSPQYQ